MAEKEQEQVTKKLGEICAPMHIEWLYKKRHCLQLVTGTILKTDQGQALLMVVVLGVN